MPVTHEFSRRAAALVTALALVMLPMTGTIAPANAEALPSTEAETSSAGTVDSDPDGSANDADAASAADSGGSTDSGSVGSEGIVATDSPGDDTGADDKDEEPTDPVSDDACDDPSEGSNNDKPCAVEEIPLKAHWASGKKTLQLTEPQGEAGNMPKSWIGKEFDGPGTEEGAKSWPVQRSSGSDGASGSTADGARSDSSTDDSGKSVSEATDDVPDKYAFNNKGFIVEADHPGEPMEFQKFDKAPTPAWTFKSDGEDITLVSGEQYPPAPDDGTANQNGNDDDASTKTGDNDETSANKDSSSNSSSKADSTTDANGSKSNADSSAETSSDPKATSNSDSKTSSDTSSDSNSSDSAKADSKDAGSSDADSADAADADAANQSSDSDPSAKSDGSDSASSDKDNDKDADKDGSGSTSGDEGNRGDDTTPDPVTGNGSTDTRDEIPGDVGDDWLPGNAESSPPPDYSDPVPQDPDKPVPDDDTDLITGGDQPEPRGNNNPPTSFGESIISTIVSSWPVFILAAFGMAAVGFIIYLVGRRNKEN